MDIEKIYIAVGSAALGWLSSQLTGFLTKRSELKKMTRQTIFHLLNLYEWIALKDVTGVVNAMISNMIRPMESEFKGDQELEAMIKDTIEKGKVQVYGVLAASILKNLTREKSEYDKAIAGLSKLSPTKAFKLSAASDLNNLETCCTFFQEQNTIYDEVRFEYHRKLLCTFISNSKALVKNSILELAGMLSKSEVLKYENQCRQIELKNENQGTYAVENTSVELGMAYKMQLK